MKPFESRAPAACGTFLACWQLLAVALLALLAFAAPLPGQTPNPVPFVNQPVVPSAVEPGGPDFTLTVNGTGFAPGATVNWNGTPLPTTFVSGSQLTASVPASHIAMIGSVSVTVTNPSPGGGVSNPVPFLITFQNPSVSFRQTDFGSTGGSRAVAAADFNGDGRADLAMLLDTEVQVYLGNGDGTFQPALSFARGGPPITSPAAIVACDLNNDGNADLAVPNALDENPDHGSIWISLGHGDGTFARPADYFIPDFHPSRVVCADLNGDGALDFAALGRGESGLHRDVGVFLGRGDGTFLPHNTYTAVEEAYSPTSLAVGDFNRDGVLDLAIAAYASRSGQQVVLLGNGDGTFRQGPPLIQRGGFSLLAADFDGDTKGDLTVIDPPYPCCQLGSYLLFLRGNGDGSFSVSSSFMGSGSQPFDVVGADLSGDGNLDLAFALSGYVASNFREGFSIRLGNGDGTFPTSRFYFLNQEMAPLAAADFDGDGRVDLVGSIDSSGTDSVFMQPSLVDLNPKRLAFGDHRVGTASDPLPTTLTNNLQGPLSISVIALTGTNSADFTQSNDCPLSPATLAAGDSCAVSVTFLHENLGEKTAAVTITDDALGYPQQVVNLTGTVVDPTVVLSPTEFDFGTQPLLITSTPQNVTLTNSGVGRLTITGIHAIGQHFAATNDCGIWVDEGAHCAITMTYTPKTLGTHDEAVVIYDNAADSPQIINLRGTSEAATVTLSPGSLNFGEQTIPTTSAPQTLTVLNSGSVNLLLTSIALTGSFDYVSHCQLLAPIPPAGSCSFDIAFRPTQIGTNNGTLTLGDNAAGSPQVVNLTGTGLPSATVTVAPASLEFGEQEAGTTSAVKQVNVTNTGNDPVLINSIGVTGDFTRAHDCPASLPVATSCTVIVSFRPTAPGTRTGTLTVTDNAVGSPHSVSLTGTGTGPGVSLSPSALDFGGQIVEGSSAAQTVTLTNNGTAALNISSIAITGTDAGEFEPTHTCGANLAADANCRISVTFNPASTGAKTAQLSIESNAYGSPYSVALGGTGTDFTLNAQSGGSLSASVSAGQTATYNLQIEPSGFSGDVALGCAFQGTQPPGTRCSVSPSSVTLNGTGPVAFTVSASTTAPATAAASLFFCRRPLGPWGRQVVPLESVRAVLLTLLLGIAFLAAAFTVTPGRQRAELLSAPPQGTPSVRFVLATILLVALVWGSCGGERPIVPLENQPTPAGNYTLVLSATAGGVTKTTSLGLQVN